MNTNSEYLHNYIKKVAKNEISSTDTSGVYTGVIKAALPGHYEVTLNQSDSESTILAIAMSSVDIYEKDDYVYLLRAEISTTINYFIFGKVDAVQETFFNLTDAERFLIDTTISPLEYDTMESSVIIEKDTDNTPTFNKIIDLGYFQFECNINAQGNEDQKPFGFKITFLNEQDAVLEDFIFNSTEFYGQPFAESYISFNSKVCHLKTDIDKDAFQKIVISKLEGDKYFTGFSADNVKIVAGSMLEVTAAYQNKITVSNDKNYFDKGENNTGLNNITLISNVYYNNKKLSADTLQYYWLLKDDTITEGNESYLEYAGNGWRCLNSVQNINGINTNGNNIEIRLWDNKNNVIQLDKTTNAVNFSNFVNKVKCLVKYFDTFIESDIIDIYNYENEEFSVELSSTTDSKTIAFKNDKIILKCDIINQNDKIDIKNYIKEYRWYLEDLDGDINITPKDKEGKENTNYNTLTIFDSAYTGELEGNQYKFEEGKTQGSFYCKVTLKPKASAAGLLEKSESVLVDSKAAEVEVTQNIEYKYYIANNHSVIFEETTKTAEGGNTVNAGDWLINGDENPDWIYKDIVEKIGFFDDEGNSKVFNDLTIFNNGNYDKTEEWFIYYTQRTVWKEGGITFKTEHWRFPQIARSVIYLNGWKNHRIGNNINQLNTFNQLTKNGEEDGIYYAEIPELVKDSSTPTWGITYYKRITTNSNITYQPISLKETITFKEDESYYIYDTDNDSYSLIAKTEGYNSELEYYKKISDTEYKKLIVNTQNFDITVAWPDEEEGPFYQNIDNKLFINATYIRSGTLEVKDKFYASIDQEDVRIAGFNVNEMILESNNETVGLNSNDSQKTNVAIWAGKQKEDKYPFQVTHEGKMNVEDADIKGIIRAKELYIGDSEKSLIEASTNILGLNSENFYINSDNFKLNYNENTYSENYLKIKTSAVELDENNFIINTDKTIFNGDLEANLLASDAVRSKNYTHQTNGSYSAPTLENGGVQIGNYFFSKTGSFLDLQQGNLYTPNILLMGTSGDLIIRGSLKTWERTGNSNSIPNNSKFYLLFRPTEVTSVAIDGGLKKYILSFDNVEVLYPAWWTLKPEENNKEADWTGFSDIVPQCNFSNSSSFSAEKWDDYSNLKIFQEKNKIIVNGTATLLSDYFESSLTSIQINDFNFGFSFRALVKGSACINLQDIPSLAFGTNFTIDEEGYMNNSKGFLGKAFEYNQESGYLYLYPSDSRKYSGYAVNSGSYFSNLDGKCGLLSQNKNSKLNSVDLAKDIFLFAGAPIPIWDHENDFDNVHKWWGDVNHANLRITTNGDLYLTNFPVVRPTGYNPFQSSGTLNIVGWGSLLEEQDITDNDDYAEYKITNFLRNLKVKKVKQKEDTIDKYRFSLTTREVYQTANDANQSLFPDSYLDSEIYACGLSYNYIYKTDSSSSIDGQSIGIRYDEIIAMLVVAIQDLYNQIEK